MADQTRILIEDADRGYAFELVQKGISVNIAVSFEKSTLRDGKLLNKSNETVNINVNGQLDSTQGIESLLSQDALAMEIAGVMMEKMASGYIFESRAKAVSDESQAALTSSDTEQVAKSKR